MPRASISTEGERFELETCPGAFVVIRRMPYGMWLKRTEMAMTMKIEAERGKQGFGGEMVAANQKVTAFEFKECIVDHNLDKDDEGTRFDFQRVGELNLLDPRIGNEIGQRISELHEFDLGNSNSGSGQASS